MKNVYCLIVGLFFGFAAFAQQPDTTNAKSSQTAVIRDMPDPPKNLKFLSIVDGKQHYGSRIKKVNPKFIINVEVLDKKDEGVYGAQGANGVMIITTMKYAVKVYEQKLSDFSQQYKLYLKGNHGNDNAIAYTINGDAFEGDKIDRIMKLYKVPADKIKTLVITENPNYNGFGNKATVAITIAN